MFTSKVSVFIQDQVVTIASAPSLKNSERGSRLTKNAILTAVLTWVRAQLEGRGDGEKDRRTG